MSGVRILFRIGTWRCFQHFILRRLVCRADLRIDQVAWSDGALLEELSVDVIRSDGIELWVLCVGKFSIRGMPKKEDNLSRFRILFRIRTWRCFQHLFIFVLFAAPIYESIKSPEVTEHCLKSYPLTYYVLMGSKCKFCLLFSDWKHLYKRYAKISTSWKTVWVESSFISGQPYEGVSNTVFIKPCLPPRSTNRSRFQCL